MNADIRICIFTYQALHRKTLDVLGRLKMLGYKNVCVYAKPYHYQKHYVPLVEHRPAIEEYDSLQKIGYESIIRNFGYELRNISAYEQIDETADSIFLIGGAGIISESVIGRYRIINAHPGYIPVVRGLDSLKWAILEGLPIGVTTHLLGAYVDAGQILERRRVPVYENDTFHTVAQRSYELEVQMLVDAIDKVDQIAFFTDGEDYPVHRRMPHEAERKLYEAFEKYRAEYPNGRAGY